MRNLPDNTVERLSQYRRSLLICLNKGKQHIYSHEIARLHHITPVMVRRDLMLIGYTGTLRKGYEIRDLIAKIGDILDTPEGLRVAIVGLGNLGRALVSYFIGKRSKLTIAASFDINPEKVEKMFSGIPCYHINELESVIQKTGISMAILSVPPEEAISVAEKLATSGIRGILNFTGKPLQVSQSVFLEEYDMITSLEKVAYFVKHNINPYS